MSLADLQAANVSLMLEADNGLSEAVTVFAGHDAKRTIQAVVLNEKGNRDNESSHDLQAAQIDVLFAKDETTGVSVPVRGLSIARTGIGQAETARCDFHHVVEQGASHWVLVFVRSELFKSGQSRSSQF